MNLLVMNFMFNGATEMFENSLPSSLSGSQRLCFEAAVNLLNILAENIKFGLVAVKYTRLFTRFL